MTFYKIHWLVSPSRDKLVHCQSVYCRIASSLATCHLFTERLNDLISISDLIRLAAYTVIDLFSIRHFSLCFFFFFVSIKSSHRSTSLKTCSICSDTIFHAFTFRLTNCTPLDVKRNLFRYYNLVCNGIGNRKKLSHLCDVTSSSLQLHF